MLKFLITLLTVNLVYVTMTACSLISIHGPETAHVVSQLPGNSHQILIDTIQDIEIASGEEFLSQPRSRFVIEVSYDDLEENTLGQAFTDRYNFCIVKINRKIDPFKNRHYTIEDLRAVIAHEVGHCFGLNHVPDESSLMYWAYDRTQNSERSFMEFVQQLKKARGVK